MGFKADCDAQADLIFSDFDALRTAVIGANPVTITAKLNNLGGSLASLKDMGDDHFGSSVGTNSGAIDCTRRHY